MQPNDVLRHNLRSVALFASSGEIGQFQYFFRSVELPSLLDLRIRAVEDSWPHDDLFQFLPRSSCALQRLTLDPGIYFTHTELILALHSVPGLVELEFTQRTGPEEYPAFNNHVLERLTLGAITTSDSPTSTALLRNLRTLSLVGRFPSDITAALINMLGSRIQVNHEPKLQSLYLQPHPYDSDDESVPSADAWKASDAEQVKSTLANTEFVIVIDSGWDSCAFGELL
ncbi:hypothetical protein FIBSPDRAFT_960284 [Athelia psychrophila]|uniref:F-box domain-containing protein n=1 Tax=Athelia psychrophila TaxID=1759441 RepID=A0A166CJN1_9AGAM|nr:hypothetical protein FIBSPDRAFT_960284 [Fibularhizoctonia sp. CBS 109695]